MSRAMLYFLYGAGFCLLFLLGRLLLFGISPFGGKLPVLILLFGVAGVVFAIYEYLTERIIHALKR